MKDSSGASQRKISKFLYMVVGFSILKSFKPIESYLVPYLVNYKELTNFQVTNKVMPIISYGALAFTILAAPACEYFSYWTVIQIGSFAAMIWPLLLRFGRTLLIMQIMEVIACCSTASATVFQAYIFLLVSVDEFQTLTSINQGSLSASLFLSAELGQILVLIGIAYDKIADITVAASIIACIMGFFLPKDAPEKETQPFLLNFFSRDQGFWKTVKDTWRDKTLQILSFWWAAAVAGFGLSLNYGTTLFAAISSASTYNGQVIAAGTGCAVLSAFCSIYLAKFVAKTGGIVYIVGSVIYGAVCLTMAFSRSLWLAYALYIVLVTTEKLLICFVYAQCGSLLKNERYILLFSFNTGMSYVIMAVLQAILEVSELDIYQQYIAFGSYFVVMAVLFSILFGVQLRKIHTMEDVSCYYENIDEESNGTVINAAYEPLLQNHVVNDQEESC